jgi:hypothetical protein
MVADSSPDTRERFWPGLSSFATISTPAEEHESYHRGLSPSKLVQPPKDKAAFGLSPFRWSSSKIFEDKHGNG